MPTPQGAGLKLLWPNGNADNTQLRTLMSACFRGQINIRSCHLMLVKVVSEEVKSTSSTQTSDD
ncbi:hypothetical protein GCM10009582_09720 [Arthrobacter flavus]